MTRDYCGRCRQKVDGGGPCPLSSCHAIQYAPKVKIELCERCQVAGEALLDCASKRVRHYIIPPYLVRPPHVYQPSCCGKNHFIISEEAAAYATKMWGPIPAPPIGALVQNL